MFGIGPLELAVVLVIALLILGPKKLPELARGLGKGLSEFRRASNDLRRSLDMDLEPHKIEPPPAPAQTSAPHVPPELGSALEQAEKEAEQRKEAVGRPPRIEPEPAPAPPADAQALAGGPEDAAAGSGEVAEAGPEPRGGAGSPRD